MGLNTDPNARFLRNGCIRNIVTMWINNTVCIKTEAKVDPEVSNINFDVLTVYRR